jgi:hypothetical protein
MNRSDVTCEPQNCSNLFANPALYADNQLQRSGLRRNLAAKSTFQQPARAYPLLANPYPVVEALLWGEVMKSSYNCSPERVDGSAYRFAKYVFELGEGVLNEVEVRVIGMREVQSGARGIDRFADRGAFVT